MIRVEHSSAKTGGRDDWRTPQEVFEKYDKTHEFDLDAAANEENHLCASWFGPGSDLAEDALANGWKIDNANPSRVWLNPPYSRNAEFVKKAREEADAGNATVVMLLPARTDTRWFHEYIWDQYGGGPRPRTSVEFLRGRVKFEGVPTRSGNIEPAPSPSMVVTFAPSAPFPFPDEG